MKTLLLVGTTVVALAAANLVPAMAQATKPVSQVVQWNRTLLVIVRTPGAQPATCATEAVGNTTRTPPTQALMPS
jgi:hypothetical protein